MKNELLQKKAVITALSLCFLLGCGNAQNDVQTMEPEPPESQTVPSQTSQSDETQTAESETEQSQSSESSEAVEETDLTFADLPGYTFTFSSGAGAWATELTIEKDGYFHGAYHDSDMGDIGEGYDNGTVYSSVFSGHFTDLTKVDDTVWTMNVADISYEDTVGETQIDAYDKIRYIYTEAYGLGDSMQIYWKQTPTAELSEDVMSWVGIWLENAGNESVLSMPVLADPETGNAFYSYERETPYEEAKTLLVLYQSSYEEMEAAAQQATTQGDMNLCAQKMYENNDACLNKIWILVKYNTNEQRFAEILEEQRAWIAEKEAEEERIRTDWDGGSGMPLDLYSTLADMTMERCKVLAEYLAK